MPGTHTISLPESSSTPENLRTLLVDTNSDEKTPLLELSTMTQFVTFSPFGSEDDSISAEGEFLTESWLMKITSPSVLIAAE